MHVRGDTEHLTAGAAEMGRQGRQMPTQLCWGNTQLTAKVELEKPAAWLGNDDIFKQAQATYVATRLDATEQAMVQINKQIHGHIPMLNLESRDLSRDLWSVAIF